MAWIEQNTLFHVGLGFRVGFADAQIRGRKEYRPKNAVFFRGKRHDNNMLKAQILLSRNLLSLRRLL